MCPPTLNMHKSALFIFMVLLFTACNAFRSKGTARLEKADKPKFGRIVVSGPSGWYCVEFEKTRTQPEKGALQISGVGRGKCPMFGGYHFDSTDYPQASEEFTLEPDQPRLIYHNTDRSYEIYALITKDPSLPARLGK
ncbi:MAG: hypothetical protein U1F16_00795 [Turneriella sp.]